MRVILLFFSLLIAVPRVLSQPLNFTTESWNFGTIAEESGRVTHTFRFRNEGSSPAVIHNVRTSCGCTSTDFSRKPIAAGDESTIEIAFEPLNQVGAVSKSVYIYSTAQREPQILTINGVVTPRVRSLRERYPYTLGEGGRIEMLYLTIPGLAKGDMAQSSVSYTNSSERAMEVEFRPRSDREELRLFYDSGVAAGGEVTLEVGYFIERKLTRDEIIRDTLDIYVNGVRSDKSLYIKGVTSSLF